MLSLFFYGTLMDPDLRAAVLGGPCLSVRPAVLRNYRRAPVAGADYPGIAPAGGQSVPGLLATGVTPVMAARASVYEGDQYQSTLLSIIAEDDSEHGAWTYVSLPGLRLAADDWSLASWQRRHKTTAVKAARSCMTTLPTHEFGRHLTSWQAAQRRLIRP